MSRNYVKVSRNGIEVITGGSGGSTVGLSSTVSGLSTAVSGLNTTVTSMGASMTTLASNIADLVGDVVDLQSEPVSNVTVEVINGRVVVRDPFGDIPMVTKAELEEISNVISSRPGTGSDSPFERTILPVGEYFDSYLGSNGMSPTPLAPYVMERVISGSVDRNATGNPLLSADQSKIYRLDSNLNVTFDQSVPIYTNAIPNILGATLHAPHESILKEYTDSNTFPEYTIQVMQSYKAYVDGMKSAIEYFLNRGIAPPPPDFLPEYAGFFVARSSEDIVCIRFNDDTTLDLWFSFNKATPQLTRPSNVGDITFAGINIPLTTSQSTFTTAIENQTDMVLYESDGFIHIRLFDSPFVDSRRSATGLYIAAFSGSFALFKRDDRYSLTRATRDTMTNLMQCSDVTVKFGEVANTNTVTRAYNFKNKDTGKYSGFKFVEFGNGSPNLDMYLQAPYSTLNGVAMVTWPNKINKGDNIFTTIVETGANETTFHIIGFGNIAKYTSADGIRKQGIWLGREAFINAPTPEQLYAGGLDVLDAKPQNFNVYTKSRDATLLTVHEYVHNYQQGVGALSNRGRVVPAETHATAVELDPALSDGYIAQFRCRAFVFYIYPLLRGKYTLGEDKGSGDGYNGPGDPDLLYPEYGQAIYDHWVVTAYDKNYQIMRRVTELLTASTVFKTPGTTIDSTSRKPYRLAYKLALVELNIRDAEGVPVTLNTILSDFLVMVSLLRNNPEIPKQYRTSIPFHIWCQTVKDHLKDRYNTTISDVALEIWWEMFDKNTPISRTNWAVIDTNYWRDEQEGQTMRPTWPSGVTSQDIKLADTALKVWVIDVDSYSNVNLTVAAGIFTMMVSMFDPISKTFKLAREMDISASCTLDLTQFRNHNGASVQLGVVATTINEEAGGLETEANWAPIVIPTGSEYLPVTDQSADTVLRGGAVTHRDRRAEVVGIYKMMDCFNWKNFATLTLNV
jgi:hypothetical protein